MPVMIVVKSRMSGEVALWVLMEVLMGTDGDTATLYVVLYLSVFNFYELLLRHAFHLLSYPTQLYVLFQLSC